MSSDPPASLIIRWILLPSLVFSGLLRPFSGPGLSPSRGIEVLAALVLLLVSCTPTPLPTPPRSLWGEIITLGQAEQTHAPALAIEPERIVAAWIGADHTGIHHDLRLVAANAPPVAVLPLPPVRPYAQQLAPARDGNVHLLWLDAGEGGETRLFSALVTPEQTVERGPMALSDRLTLRYTIALNDDGSLWALWNGAPVAEPVLHAQYVDRLGRPRAPIRLVSDADWPTITYTSSGVYLFWIQAGRVHRARFVDGGLGAMEVISEGVTLGNGDRLTGFRAGTDHTHGYLFWNVTRVGGQFETWFSTGPLDSTTWSEPQRLGVDWTTKSFIETGFNGGHAFPAQYGDRWLSWTVPVTGQLDTLPAAAMQAGNLALIYFHSGEVIGYQNIAPITGLIGPPTLMTDRDLHLYLAWAEPTVSGYADLKLTMTRRL